MTWDEFVAMLPGLKVKGAAAIWYSIFNRYEDKEGIALRLMPWNPDDYSSGAVRVQFYHLPRESNVKAEYLLYWIEGKWATYEQVRRGIDRKTYHATL